MKDHASFELLIEVVRELDSLGLNRGSTGNCSVRLSEDRFLITPSGIPSLAITREMLCTMDFVTPPRAEKIGPVEKVWQPSSEWRFHRDIYLQRSDVGAIVHVHSNYATTLSCLRRAIPSFHYMVAVAGGVDIRCAGYETYGTQELSDQVLIALTDRKACLMANHGMIAVGENLSRALATAITVESLAQQFLSCLSVGEPTLLSEIEMSKVLMKFSEYQKQALD